MQKNWLKRDVCAGCGFAQKYGFAHDATHWPLLHVEPPPHVPHVPPHPSLPHCLPAQFAVRGSVAEHAPYWPLEQTCVPLAVHVPNATVQPFEAGPQSSVPPHVSDCCPQLKPSWLHVGGVFAVALHPPHAPLVHVCVPDCWHAPVPAVHACVCPFTHPLQLPALHVWPAPHAWPQLPQLPASPWRLTHDAPHCEKPLLHTHVEPLCCAFATHE